jgi:predicted Ser/Thr protein kinase
MAEGKGRSGERRDALLAKTALERGWLNPAQLREAFAAQLQEPHPARPLGVILVALGHLSPERAAELLAAQAVQTSVQTPPSTPGFPPFGHFLLARELGRGGMGVVYEAVDTLAKRKVALKILHPVPAKDPKEEAPERERFLREAELSRRLPGHAGIVPVREAGELDGRRYLVMDFVAGRPLSEWRRQGSITIRQHLAILRDIALAIHHAHEHGIVHRDLKPENVLVDGENRPRVTDFGLAKILGEAPAVSATGGMPVGTPAYMSPEQVQGRKDLDRRTDVYSLGVMLYETMTGVRPFQGATPFEIMTKIVNEPVRPPSKFTKLQINPILYKNLENICLIAMAKDPADRYPSAKAFADDLTQWLKGEDVKAVLPLRLRAWRAKRLLPRIAAVAALALLTGGGALWLALRPAPEVRPAGVKPELLRPGARLECFVGTNFSAPALRRADLRPVFEESADRAWPEGPRVWISLRWTGWLRIAEPGVFAFRATAAEGVRLLVGGRPVVDRWTSQDRDALTGKAELARGLHAFVLEHFRTREGDGVALEWGREGAEFRPLGPSQLLQDPAALPDFTPEASPDDGPRLFPGAIEGESLEVLSSGVSPVRVKVYDDFRLLWKGQWSGRGHLWWGEKNVPGERLRLAFLSKLSGRRTLVLALTRASDHGIFKVSVNGAVVAERLDLYDPGLRTGDVEFPGVELKAGPNELEFEVVGMHPDARSWGPATGLYKLGLDTLQIR